MKLKELYGEIVVLMSYCAVGDIDYLSSTKCIDRFDRILENLKKYKNIEEEFGIDLKIFFKFIREKKGWCVESSGNNKIRRFYLDDLPNLINIKDSSFIATINCGKYACYEREYLLKDYGKTWALTKEELEK